MLLDLCKSTRLAHHNVAGHKAYAHKGRNFSLAPIEIHFAEKSADQFVLYVKVHRWLHSVILM
jgi:hypothetical protein